MMKVLGSSTVNNTSVTPSAIGSVIYPLIAVMAAASGLPRYTEASSVPLRPLKLRFDVRKDTPCVRGAWPIPTQGPQPHSRIRTPASTSVEIMPSRSAMEKI